MVLLTAVLTIPLLSSTAAAASPQAMRFDGGGGDTATTLAVDADGKTYLAGPDTFSVARISRQDKVIQRDDFVYSGSQGGVGGQVYAAAIDQAGNIYAAGAILGQNLDALLVVWGPDGAERWARRYDGPVAGVDYLSEVVVDPSGDVYVSGTSQGAGAVDSFCQRYTADGTLLWTHNGPGCIADTALAPGGGTVVAGTGRNTGSG